MGHLQTYTQIRNLTSSCCRYSIMSHQRQGFALLLFVLLLLQVGDSWGGWFFSSNQDTDSKPNPADYHSTVPKLVGAQFSLENLNDDEKALELINAAKSQMRAGSSCWVNAYSSLFAGCSKILSDQDLKDRLTWGLSDCYLRHTGRTPFPSCSRRRPTIDCVKKLDDDHHRTYQLYFLHIDSICHQLQILAFKHQTERLINDLKSSAEYAETKLEVIEGRGKILLQNSKEIHGSLESIDLHTQHIVQTSKEVQDNVNVLKEHSLKLYEQSKGIADSQEELVDGQRRMKDKLDEGMEMLHDSYHSLGEEITCLKNETVEIEKEIGRVGEQMFSKMSNLQNKADDIENLTGSALDKQKLLLEGQLTALDGLHLLTKFQSEALEESRGTLQQLAEFGKKQQEELLLRQEQLQQVHNHLAENSKTILAAQEAFESKQVRMLNAIDKLFTLHTEMLNESRSVKIFIIYTLLIFVLYMFTSMKQTYNVRTRLYVGLCVALFIELSIIRFTTVSLEPKAWTVISVRSLFLILASIQLLYAIWTYRDYEVLNHQILLTLIDKVNGMQRFKEWEYEIDEDSEVNWSSWVEAELPEDVAKLEDPDYIYAEEVRENSLEPNTSSQRYNLRNRHRYIKY